MGSELHELAHAEVRGLSPAWTRSIEYGMPGFRIEATGLR